MGVTLQLIGDPVSTASHRAHRVHRDFLQQVHRRDAESAEVLVFLSDFLRRKNQTNCSATSWNLSMLRKKVLVHERAVRTSCESRLTQRDCSRDLIGDPGRISSAFRKAGTGKSRTSVQRYQASLQAGYEFEATQVDPPEGMSVFCFLPSQQKAKRETELSVLSVSAVNYVSVDSVSSSPPGADGREKKTGIVE
jgi:hypothetical protein